MIHLVAIGLVITSYVQFKLGDVGASKFLFGMVAGLYIGRFGQRI